MSVALEQTGSTDAGGDLAEFEHSFEGLCDQFELLEKVGEGTFSFVYKAVDRTTSPPQIVAIKRIHATSSPKRIANELDILWALRHSERIGAATDALRFQDQVLVIMPFIEFSDFRGMYVDGSLPELQDYMRELMLALEYTAAHRVIHRDVKPTNFLYNRETRRGVLVDFGLAEWMPQFTESRPGECMCISGATPSAAPRPPQNGYLKSDTRTARRANRAGTRGFRAPEVLFKCDNQSDKIDVWAAGIGMLMMLAKRFPFFNSLDDCEALVEIASIFGKREMRAAAIIHGAVFETNIPTIQELRHPWHQVVDWCLERPERGEQERDPLEALAIDLLDRMTDLDPRRRISASEALAHPFLRRAAPPQERHELQTELQTEYERELEHELEHDPGLEHNPEPERNPELEHQLELEQRLELAGAAPEDATSEVTQPASRFDLDIYAGIGGRFDAMGAAGSDSLARELSCAE